MRNVWRVGSGQVMLMLDRALRLEALTIDDRQDHGGRAGDLEVRARGGHEPVAEHLLAVHLHADAA